VKTASLWLALVGTLGLTAAPAFGQAKSSPAATVSRTTKAVNFRRAGGATKLDFQGTELMQTALGEAKVENKGNRTEIDAKFENLEEATKFGLEYLTYVLWAVSPQGRAVNLGEVSLNHGSGHVKAISEMQTFGMIVTAEPYFAVNQPGNVVVLENVIPANSKVENIDAKYELLGRGVYSSSNTKIENAIFGIDRKTPLELFEARNAVRIAHIALADKYAPSIVAKAEQQLKTAEDVYHSGRDKRSVEAAAKEVVETAEEARVMSVKQKAEEDAQATVAAERRAALDREAKARADADAEVKRRQEADQARAAAEAAKAEAVRMKQEAEQASQDAVRQRQEAEQARAAAGGAGGGRAGGAGPGGSGVAAKSRGSRDGKGATGRGTGGSGEGAASRAVAVAAQFDSADAGFGARADCEYVRRAVRHRKLHAETGSPRKAGEDFGHRAGASGAEFAD